MKKSESNTSENKEFCRDLCKHDLEKKLQELKASLSVPSLEKLQNGYCNKNCTALFGKSKSAANDKEVIDDTKTKQSPKPSERTFTEIKSNVKNAEDNEPDNTKCTDQIQKLSHLDSVKSSNEQPEKENDYKWILSCREGKVCPTISLIVSRKKIEQAAKAAIEAALSQKLSEILSAEINQNKDYLKRMLESKENEEKGNSDKWKYNCEEGKPCPTISTMLHNYFQEKPVKIPSSTVEKDPKTLSAANSRKSVEEKQQSPVDLDSTKKSDIDSNNNNNTKIQVRKSLSILTQNALEELLQQRRTDKPNKITSRIEEGSKIIERPNPEMNTRDVTQEPSVEIKTTDLSNKPNQNSLSIFSHEICEGENELQKWKRNCENGIYSLEHLVDACEKNPDSILALASLKVGLGLGTDRNLSNGRSQSGNENKPFFLMEQTHGDKFGDPKYHLLMVDAETSLCTRDLEKIPEKSEKASQLVSIVRHRADGSKPGSIRYKDDEEDVEIKKEVEEEQEDEGEEGGDEEEEQDEEKEEPEEEQEEKEEEQEEEQEESEEQEETEEQEEEKEQEEQEEEKEEDKTLIKEEQEEEDEQEEVVEEVFKDEGYQTLAVPPPIENELNENTSEKSDSPRSSLQKEPRSGPKDKKASINFKEELVEIDDEKKKQYVKRPSAVSWRALNAPSDTESTASLEQVIKDATTKAENFRQNLDTKRQHSLLDIVKRRSTIEDTIEEPKPVTSTTKRKKFFSFPCLKKKKPPEKEKEETHSDSEEESVEEMDEKKPTHSSSMYIDNYRRRNTSFIENPVFEKKKELNQFLNNI